MKVFDQVFNVLERSMDLRFRRHALLTGNVSNSDTPGYRAKELDFAGELERMAGLEKNPVQKTDAHHMDVTGSSQAHFTFDDSGAMGADGNNVDLDIAMGKVSTNARAYSNALTMYDLKLRMLRLALRNRAGGF
jgi:flagellar basal-body rod protein FlgB